MATEQNAHKRGNDSYPTGRRRVRFLLGLPDQGAGMQGQGPLPPGAFRYHMQAGLEDPRSPVPFSHHPPAHPGGSADGLSSTDEAEATTSAMPPDKSAWIARQIGVQADDGQGRITQQPASQARASQSIQEEQAGQTTAQMREMQIPEPTASPVQRPPIGQAEQAAHTQMQMRPNEAPPMPAADTARAPRQTVAESSPTAGQQKRHEPGSRQEIAIPGKSTVRQFFAALAAAAEDEGLSTADQSPAPAQQPASQSTGQPQVKRTVVAPDAQPVPQQRSRQKSISPADPQPRPTAGTLPTATPVTSATPQTAATQTIRPGVMQGGPFAENRAEKNTEQGSAASTTSDMQETQATIVSRIEQQHAPGQTHGPSGAEKLHTAITPARQSDGDGVQRIEELRRTFYELVSKKTSASEPKVNEPARAAETEAPPQPPLQPVLVINRSSGSRSRSRAPYAFWERSGLARTMLKMNR